MFNECSESQRRLYEKLHQDMGQDLIDLMRDNKIHELMLNPDGQLWVDDCYKGQYPITRLKKETVLSIIHSIAGIQDLVVSQRNPQLETELPFYKELRGERFTAQIPPIVSGPCFSIRKRTQVIQTLNDYLSSSRLTENQIAILKDFVNQRKNILICGGPGSGKTTLTNALIAEAIQQDAQQRFLILEDVPELNCSAPNKVSMITSEHINMTQLLRAAMRMRPDRILIGEVRGREALDMLKAWNTGCPGGICTVHANGATEAMQRIIDLAIEAHLTLPPYRLMAHTIHAIVSLISQGSQKGFVQEILILKGVEHDQFQFEKVA